MPEPRKLVPPAEYAMETPTASGVVHSIVSSMGQEEGIRAWRAACASAGQQWPGVGDEIATLLRVLETMASQGGLAEVVARSSIIRLHTWSMLARMNSMLPRKPAGQPGQGGPNHGQK